MRYSFPMKKDMRKGIEVAASIEGFEAAQAFVEDLLENTSVSREIAHATILVFDTVFDTLLTQDIDHNTPIRISAEDRLGGMFLKISYEGKRFAPVEDSDGESFERRLLEGYADKVSHSYRSGLNIIRISIHKSPRRFFIPCGMGFLLAIAAYAVIAAFTSPEEQQAMLGNYVFPFERLFANAVLMVGAPVTFFSLLKNASDAVIVSERVLNARRLHVKSIATSAFAILLALGLSVILWIVTSSWRGYDASYAGLHVTWSLPETIVSMIPANIFEPFESISPIPLIAVALLVTYSLIAAGKDFDVLKVAIDVCYGLFSRMLGAVMVALPVACFLAILDVLLGGGYKALAFTMARILFFIVSTFVLLATFAIRLKAKGVKVGWFARKLVPLLRENSAIGSAIDAAPFNIRYCVKHYGMDRTLLSRILPVLAQTNRDGNCFLIMFIATVYIYASGMDISPVNIAVIAVLVLFLSFGAPNQPGSILIGTFIITNYLGSYDIISLAICLEVFLGGAQIMLNVISDIVSAAEEEGVLR